MAPAKPHFRLFGIPVRVELFFFLVLVFFGFGYGYRVGDPQFHTEYVISFVLIAAVSILIHELGHALAFKHYGVQPSITLHGLGGVTTGSGDLTPGRSILISLAGPVPPLVLIGLPAWLVWSSTGWTSDVILEQILFVNVLWSVFNLLPILPLDGGAVTASVLELAFRGRGRQIANVVSIVLSGAALLWAFSASQMFIAAFAAMFAITNVIELTRGGSADAAAAGEPLAEAHRALLYGQPHLGEQLAREALIGARGLEQQRWANELIAWARLFSGDAGAAAQHAAVMSPSRPPSRCFTGALALASGRRDEGIAVLAWSLAHEAPGPAKSLAAVAAARAGVTAEVTGELKAMGPAGVEAVRLLAQLLAYAGYEQQATAVTDSGRSPSPPESPLAGSWPTHPPTGPPTGPSPWERPTR